MAKPTILIVSTLDTKLSETLYLRDQILSHGSCNTHILDVGRSPSSTTRLGQDEVTVPPGTPLTALQRGAYIDAMITRSMPLVRDLVSRGTIHGIVSAAGTSGSSLATALMRRCCPIGFPKLQVSTAASGDVKAYVEETDVTMMYSVVDIAGVNSILKRILGNAAGAIVGMAEAYAKSRSQAAEAKEMEADGGGEAGVAGKRIAVTMFGVTTPCVDAVRRILTSPPYEPDDFEIYVFHATGAGGIAMERLISEGQIDAVIDLTTTEIADMLVGGNMPAKPNRLEAAAKRGVPTLLSVGALDMVNFGARDTVPARYRERNLYVHNPAVTLMRTTKDENIRAAGFIVDQLRTHAAKPELVKVLLPLGGVSMIDAPGQPFHDPEADAVLFETIEKGLEGTGIEVEKVVGNINDEAFAAEVCRLILELMHLDPRKWRLANQRRRKWSFDHGASLRALATRPSDG